MSGDGSATAPLRAPNPLLLAFEGRAPVDMALGALSTPLLRSAPEGDGHPVVVLPPFGAADQFTAGLRRYIKARGYEVHPWGHPEILGLHRLVRVAAERVKQVRDESGRQVSLIGHSLGGVYAREVARFMPDDVRCVITLGSPIADMKANYVWPMFETVTGTRVASLPAEFAERMREAPPVPTTSIFSRTDGVVSWRSCIDRTVGRVENIEVYGSHVGLPSNPWALYAVADRLAASPNDWQRFEPTGLAARLFPRRRGRG